jgi:hypothetical protein
MGLRDWSLFIIVENLDRENAAGYCQVTYGRRLATIKIDQATFEGGRAELRQTVVHELIHCHFAAVQWVFNGIGKQLNPNVFGAFQDSFTDRMECTVDDIAEAWARKFPLPEPPADEQEAA